MHSLAKLDHRHVWHPFTQMRDWLREEPIVIRSGRGTLLRDVLGRTYLDGNASIWTNVHGHNHPVLNQALADQLRKIAHVSALGLANEPASLLAADLVRVARLGGRNPVSGGPRGSLTNPRLTKVFYSDDGSTGIEVALKLAYEGARRLRGLRKPRFLSLQGAYHGDTVGAVSLGHVDLFHKTYGGLLFASDAVMAPYCYRCPFNKARPERADARQYRKCRWECVGQVELRLKRQRKQRGEAYAAMVLEPLIQGAAGMIPHPEGWLRQVAERVRAHGIWLIADEVMTGFGRAVTLQANSGSVPGRTEPDPALFGCHQEGVQPDFLVLAKGLTGGYLPMAATLTTTAVFNAFLGEYAESKTFFHGHSYTANPLGAAVARASLGLLQRKTSIQARARLERALREASESLWALPNVGDVRQVGLVLGVELVRDWRTREPWDLRHQVGIKVCKAMARRGVLTRPVGNVVVLMPPYSTTSSQAERMVAALKASVREVFGAG